jgi:aldehyde:ferredoxin oxidoreductase
MRYAETGFNLEIDLSKGKIERVETDPKLTELYLGGLGTNAKILWDRVPPEVEPFSPENLLIFSAGLLVGTSAPGANRTIVSTISPETLLFGYSMMGGFWAPELKFAGYDKIIFRGKSPDLVYLWIHNDKVEICDASHLRGKGSTETEELIKQELKEPRAQVASIGLAGENRVHLASIQHLRGSCSSMGVGAVMGDKGLKAIAVRGTKDVNIAKPEELWEVSDYVVKYARHRENNPITGTTMAGIAKLGIREFTMMDEGWHLGMFSRGHARDRKKDFYTPEIEKRWTETLEKEVDRLTGCFGCAVGCAGLLSHQGLRYRSRQKCSQHVRYIPAARSENYDFGTKISAIGEEHGIDGFSAPLLMAFAVELYEDGILTDKDMPGFPPRGAKGDDEERFYWLMEKIVRREGIGDILANGTYWAARQIKGAEKYDHNTIKKHEQAPIKLGMLNPIYFLQYSTGEKMNITQIEGQFPQEPMEKMEDREYFVKDWVQALNERMKQHFLNWEPFTFPHQPPIDACCEIVDWTEMMHNIDDCLGMCALVSSWILKPPYHIHNLPNVISAAAALDIDEEGLKKTGRRVRNLVRAINVRRGMRRKDERPPDDHWKHRFPELEKQLLDEYYKFKGWNDQGIPTRETLHELDLDFVGEDFERRGILENKKG